MNLEPAEGERRAATGYRHQYLVGAALILNQLNTRQLEWIRVADPEAGRVDDLQGDCERETTKEEEPGLSKSIAAADVVKPVVPGRRGIL